MVKNPFRIGIPVQNPADFFGREKILQDLSGYMSDLQNVSLRGERRTGKTSLLLYLAHPASSKITGLPLTNIPVYFNFQALGNKVDMATVWKAIALAVAEQIKRNLPNGQAESEKFIKTIATYSASGLFATGFGTAFFNLPGKCNIHLLFDEFEQTAGNLNLGDPFYDALRSLPTRAENVSYIIATRTGLAQLQLFDNKMRLARLQSVHKKLSSPLFNIFTNLTLLPLQEDDVYFLIADYFDRAGADISLAEKLCAESSFLYGVTGYHPFFLQMLCYHLWKQLGAHDWPSGQARKKALQNFEEDAAPHFEYYWQVSTKEEQELIRKLAADKPFVNWNKEETNGLIKNLKNRCLVVRANIPELKWKLFSSSFSDWVNRNTIPPVSPVFARQQLSAIQEALKIRCKLSGHQEMIGLVSWSPDGQTLASPSADKTIRLWDAKTGKLLRTFEGHEGIVYSVTWSPNGRKIASASQDKTIRLWDATSGKHLKTLEGHEKTVYGVAWSPVNGQQIASASQDATIRLWDIESGEMRLLLGHEGGVYNVAWSPNGRMLASASRDSTVRLWGAATAQALRVLSGHVGRVVSVAWSPDGRLLASGSEDRTIRLWEPNTGQLTFILEGHTNNIVNISFSWDSHLLASNALGDQGYIWRVAANATGDRFKISDKLSPTTAMLGGTVFHPRKFVLATLGDDNKSICIWGLEPAKLNEMLGIEATRYTNAKIVLLGDSGVGKSGLALALTGQAFVATESTHGRRVWSFDSQEIEAPDRFREDREVLLWDLAGQPGYRLIHQLHLNEVAVAVAVFDARSETNPFAGIRYWIRALHQAQRVQGNTALPLKKFLAAARTDRGGVGVSRVRIDSWKHELGFDGYFETSAKEGWQIETLATALREAISWDSLPKVSSTKFFQNIKKFLIEKKNAGQLLSKQSDLYRTFLDTPHFSANGGSNEFETCIALLESQGLLQRFSFGNLVLLQPELLDAYTSAIINAAKEEPDGLGYLLEEDLLAGRFPISQDERIQDHEQEKLLLIATKEELVSHELALREHTADGAVLIFPSQLTREYPGLPEPKNKAITFSFEGAILNIYATLAVRLSHSELFAMEAMWRNAVTYRAKIQTDGACGIFLREDAEGQGELILFFERTAGKDTRFLFEDYIRTHLQRRALPDSIHWQRTLICAGCDEFVVPDRIRQLRLEKGSDWLQCPLCETKIPLTASEEHPDHSSDVSRMNDTADARREQDRLNSVLKGKIATDDFDVFLCHNSAEKTAVKEIAEQLKNNGILPWLDEWALKPGVPRQPALEKQIKQIKSAAVFIGRGGLAPWQDMETAAFLRQLVERKCPVIPVLLPDCGQNPELPAFLSGMTWVDFRKQAPEDPMQQLIWRITGKSPWNE